MAKDIVRIETGYDPTSSMIMAMMMGVMVVAVSQLIITSSARAAAVQPTQFSGNVYSNADTATDDNPRRFEESEKKLNDIIIYVSGHGQLFGDYYSQEFFVAAGGSLGFTKVDISTLYFRNASAGQNGTVYMLGTEE